jgi:uncharacterized protein YecE (DUF72 family)
VKGGLFYPRGTKTGRERLNHYARHFPLVEVDATYYTVPAPEVSAAWVTATPDAFRFDVKAHPVFTGHPVDVSRLPRELREAIPGAAAEDAPAKIRPEHLPEAVRLELVRRFHDFLGPLVSSGRLAAVFVQFPPWFSATRGNARQIESVVQSLDGLPTAIEFRHPSWLAEGRRDRVVELLSALSASYVVVDEPDVPMGGVPPDALVTNPELAVVRFHGHNRKGWHRGASVAERFDYLYSPEELAAWVPTVRKLAGEARTVHAVFNNCVRNYAVIDAKGLSVLLTKESGTPAPEPGKSPS